MAESLESQKSEADAKNFCPDPSPPKKAKFQEFAHPEPLLPAKLTRKELKLEDFYVLVVKEKEKLSTILKTVSKEFPADLKNLKRIRVDDDGIAYVLLCRKSSADFPSEFRGFEVRIMPVPVEFAETRAQFQFARSFWPVTFRENKRLESLLNRTYFTQDQLSIHSKFMRLIREMQNLNKTENFCIIVDPASNSILAKCSDSRKDHPLHHAVMNGIEFISKSVETGPESYLCTGYNCYTFREPCIMCGMALVHSRIRRLFFAQNHHENSGAFSVSEDEKKLHLLKSLNHRFDVFRGWI